MKHLIWISVPVEVGRVSYILGLPKLFFLFQFLNFVLKYAKRFFIKKVHQDIVCYEEQCSMIIIKHRFSIYLTENHNIMESVNCLMFQVVAHKMFLLNSRPSA